MTKIILKVQISHLKRVINEEFFSSFFSPIIQKRKQLESDINSDFLYI